MDNQLNSEALSRITTEIFYINGLLLAWGDRFAADLGLTSARWQMLGALAHAAEAQTSPQLGERMGMSRQGAQKQLNAVGRRFGRRRRQPRAQTLAALFAHRTRRGGVRPSAPTLAGAGGGMGAGFERGRIGDG